MLLLHKKIDLGEVDASWLGDMPQLSTAELREGRELTEAAGQYPFGLTVVVEVRIHRLALAPVEVEAVGPNLEHILIVRAEQPTSERADPLDEGKALAVCD